MEALFRSLFLVLMDNATVEYQFVTDFFGPGQTITAPVPMSAVPNTPDAGTPPDPASPAPSPLRTSEMTPKGRNRYSIVPVEQHSFTKNAKAERAALDAVWKQIVDPILDYTQACTT